MRPEQRRFFRINETIGLSYETLDNPGASTLVEESVDIMGLISERNGDIQRLLQEVSKESPKVAELVKAIDQKIERFVRLMVVENRLVDRLANKAKEVNISACGIGFISDQQIAPGTRLSLKITLFPGEKIINTKGRVIGCELEDDRYYWRIDFFDMSKAAQERLIQHMVQRQSAQLNAARNP